MRWNFGKSCVIGQSLSNFQTGRKHLQLIYQNNIDLKREIKMIPKNELEKEITHQFRNVLMLLEAIFKQVVEQEVMLNELKNILMNPNATGEDQNSLNPLDFLLQSDNEVNEHEKRNQAEAKDTNNNNEKDEVDSSGN